VVTPEQPAVVSPAEATLIVGFATLFGAFIGSITQFVISRLKARAEVDSLRKSLLAELQALPTLDEDAWLKLGYQDQPDQMIPVTVYRSNSDRIGKLNADESKAVVQFYSRVIAYKSLAKNSSGFEDEDVKESMKELLGTIEDLRSDAVDELEKNI